MSTTLPSGVKQWDGTDNVNRTALNDQFIAVDANFKGTSAAGGHTHSGVDGEGPKITSTGLADAAATDVVIGDRTIDQATSTAFTNAGKITQIFSWFAKQLKAIIGSTNWYDTPPASLTSLNTNKANLASPAFTGTPTTPTPTAGDNTTKVASTAFVTAAISAYDATNQSALSSKAALASPAFTGTPTAPTATSGDNSTRIATNAFVRGEVGDKSTLLTTSKVPVGAINELFNSVNNGKSSIAGAIVDMRGTATASQTFAELATAIRAIKTGYELNDVLIAGSMFSDQNTLSATISPGQAYGSVLTIPEPAYIDPNTGEFYVVSSGGGPPTEYYLTKYNTDGAQLWRRTYGFSFAYQFCYDGTINIQISSSWTKISKDNSVIATKTLLFPGVTTYNNVIEDINGNFLVTSTGDNTIKKFDSSLSLVWSIAYTYASGRGSIMGADKSGNFVVKKLNGGSTPTTADSTTSTVYNSSGSQLASTTETPILSTSVYYSATTHEKFDSVTGYWIRCWDNHWSSNSATIYNLGAMSGSISSGSVGTIASAGLNRDFCNRVKGYYVMGAYASSAYVVDAETYAVVDTPVFPSSMKSSGNLQSRNMGMDAKGDLLYFGYVSSVSGRFQKVARTYQYQIIKAKV